MLYIKCWFVLVLFLGFFSGFFVLVPFICSLFLFVINEEFVASQSLLPFLDKESIPNLCSSTVFTIWLLRAITYIFCIKLCKFFKDFKSQLSLGFFFFSLCSFLSSIFVKEEMNLELIRGLLLADDMSVKLSVILVIEPEIGIWILVSFLTTIILIWSIVVVTSIAISVIVASIIFPRCAVLVIRSVTFAVVVLAAFVLFLIGSSAFLTCWLLIILFIHFWLRSLTLSQTLFSRFFFDFHYKIE